MTRVLLGAALLLSLAALAGAATLIATSDWQDAYQDWRETREDAQSFLELAKLAEELGNHELAKQYRELARGMVDEKTLRFLDTAPPAELCASYLDSVVDVSLTALELLPLDTQDDLRDLLVLNILHGCSFLGPKYTLPKLPWESQWTFVLDERDDPRPNYMRDHSRLSVAGTFTVHSLPALADTLMPREDFEELVRAYGREGAYEFIRIDLFMRLSAPIQANVEGQFQSWRDSHSGSSGNQSWKCEGAPHKFVPVRYLLTLYWNETNAYGVVLERKEWQRVPNAVERCWHYSNGTLVDVAEWGHSYVPPFEKRSVYWDQEELVLRSGQQIMDRYEEYEEIAITLQCIERCR